MDEKKSPGFHICGLLTWTAALVLEAAALVFVYEFHGKNVYAVAGTAAALHLGATLVFLLPSVVKTQWYPPRSTIYALTATLTFSLPGIGLVGCLFARTCTGLLMRQKNKTKLFRQSIEMALGEDTNWINRKRIGQVLADEIAIEPVVDVLTGEDPDLKRGAVKLLKRMGTPGAVALLRSCLSDPFPEVRFYAHSALSDLEDEHTNHIKDIQKTLAAAPSAGAWRNLGREYRAYAESGLADEVARGQHLEESRAALAKSLELEPGHAETMLMLAQVLLALGRLDEATAWFEKCLGTEEIVSEARLGLAEIAFRRRDIKHLATQAREMALSAAPRPANPDALSLYEFWAGVGEARRG